MKLSKFNMFKKSQSAMEFMLIFVFIMGSVSIFMMVVGLYTQDLTVQENDKQIDSFANSIISEFEVLQEVEKGYTREIIIPKYLLEKFNITIVDNYLVIEDKENFNNLTNQRFYDIAGVYELNKFNDSKGDLHLVLNPVSTLSSNKLINLDTPTPPIANLNFLIDSLNIQTYTVSYMQDIILSWESFNVTNECIASGDWAGLKGFSGNETIFNPKGNKIFNLDCSGLVNTASSSINLTVDAPLFPTLTFMASPPVIPYNTKTNLSWQAQNMYDITSCSAGGNWTGSKFTNGSELTPNLISNTTYFLSCTNPSGTIIENVTIEVLELPEINLTINQSVIDFNTSTILNWNVKYASSCSASNDWSGNKSITGNFSTGNLLNGTYNYTLNCIGPGGNNSKSVSLEVSSELYGSGKDGNCIINSNLNLNTQSCVGRIYGDMINYNINSLINNSNIINLGTIPNGLAIGDEIILINLQGTNSDYSNVGIYEFNTISNINGNILTFKNNFNKLNGSVNQKIVLQRIPNYKNVIIDSLGIMTVSNWNGNKGGLLVFRANNNVNIKGKISVIGLGYSAGLPSIYCSIRGVQGESVGGVGVRTNIANIAGGGGGYGCVDQHSRSPGGTHATIGGEQGSYQTARAYAGTYTYGFGVNYLTLGSGAGGAGSTGGGPSGMSGDGSGIIYIIGKNINVTGNIDASGKTGEDNYWFATSGGAGGTVYLYGNLIYVGLNKVLAVGGLGSGGHYTPAGAGKGADGGNGHIKISYKTNYVGSTNPIATIIPIN